MLYIKFIYLLFYLLLHQSIDKEKPKIDIVMAMRFRYRHNGYSDVNNFPLLSI